MINRFLLTWITMSFIAGVAIGYYAFFSFEGTAGCATGALLLAFIVRRRGRLFLAGILVAFLFLGISYAVSFKEVSQGTLPQYNIFAGQEIEVEGLITSGINEQKKSSWTKHSFELAVHRIRAGACSQSLNGRILVYIFQSVTVQYGDMIRISGKFQRPFSSSKRGHSSYPDYLKRNGITWILNVSKNSKTEILKRDQGNNIYGGILNLRERLRQVLQQYLKPQEAAVMETMLLGTANNIAKPIQNLFMRTGTTHILAISGLHVTLMAVLFFILLKIFPVGRAAQYVLSIVLLLGYTVLAGGRPSVVRAFIMSSVFLASFLVERESEMLNSLSLSALVILLFNPLYLYDVGFQLSYICVLAIILVYPLLWQGIEQRWDIENRWFNHCLESLVLSFSICLSVAGLIAYYFELVSPVTILANLVVVPLSSVVLILGTGLLLTGMFAPFLAGMFATCLQVCLSLMVALIYLFAQLPGAYFAVQGVSLGDVIFYYVILAFVCFIMKKKAVVAED